MYMLQDRCCHPRSVPSGYVKVTRTKTNKLSTDRQRFAWHLNKTKPVRLNGSYELHPFALPCTDFSLAGNSPNNGLALEDAHRHEADPKVVAANDPLVNTTWAGTLLVHQKGLQGSEACGALPQWILQLSCTSALPGSVRSPVTELHAG